MNSKVQKSTRSGFALAELSVVIVICLVLFALAAPFILQMRETARQNRCQNNLRQIGLGLQECVTETEKLPVDGENGWGVGVYLLPYLNQKKLYKQLAPEVEQLTNSREADTETTGRNLATFRCPAFYGPDRIEAGFGRSNFLGNTHLFKPEGLLSDVYDGQSNTIAFGETLNDHAWALPVKTDSSIDQFNSSHVGGANFVMCDASLRFLSARIDTEIFHELLTPASQARDDF